MPVHQPIVVITGPSGVGKTTVSRLVASAFDPSVHLRIDELLDPSFVNGWIDPRLPESAHQSRVVGAASAAAALELASGGYAVVWDGHLFPDGLLGVAQMCARREVALHCAVLRADLRTCADRATRRAAEPGFRPRPAFADFDITRATDRRTFDDLHARFGDLGVFEANVVDASGPPEAVAAALFGSLRSGHLRVAAST